MLNCSSFKALGCKIIHGKKKNDVYLQYWINLVNFKHIKMNSVKHVLLLIFEAFSWLYFICSMLYLFLTLIPVIISQEDVYYLYSIRHHTVKPFINYSIIICDSSWKKCIQTYICEYWSSRLTCIQCPLLCIIESYDIDLSADRVALRSDRSGATLSAFVWRHFFQVMCQIFIYALVIVQMKIISNWKQLTSFQGLGFPFSPCKSKYTDIIKP